MPRLYRERTKQELLHLIEFDLEYVKWQLQQNPNDDEALDMVLTLLAKKKELEGRKTP
jgi:hypothetical protein